MADLQHLVALDAALREREYRAARDRLAVYAGLHLPSEVEEDDLPAFEHLTMASRYIPAAHHQIIIDALEKVERGEIKRLMILAPPGSAKALALDTPIPTPSGWTTMGALKVGDEVFDERGSVCRVTWKSPVWGNRPVYRVQTDCGDAIVADRDHEWLVRLCGKPRPANKGKFPGRPWRQFKIKETWELCKTRRKRPMIERALALELPDVELPLDPYVLGVWLGDGTAASGSITSSDEDRQWMRAEFARLGYPTTDRAAQYLFGVADIRRHLVGLGVLHDPARGVVGKKHIPEAYLRASPAQRLALLQGLIDTDGTVCRKRGCATFCNTNKDLAQGVQELVRSLGRKAGMVEGRATLYGKDCGPVYRVSFYHAAAARLPRKRALCRDQYRTPNTYIDVIPCGTADTVCIEVDSPSHLFLCGRSMTPTHNSTYASVLFPGWIMGRYPSKDIICASQTQELADRFGRRARNLVASETHRRVFGTGLAKDQRAAGQWTTEKGGEYFATGVQPFAGRRADGAITDDLIRGRKDADSMTVRNSTWEWIIGDLRPRLKPNAWWVFITTRWHQDDPAGRILPENWNGRSGWVTARDGEKWYVLSLVAVVETQEEADHDPLCREVGEIIWPEWFTPEMLAQEKRSQGTRNWNALYQQKPRDEESAILKRAWWKKWPSKIPPKCDYVVSVYDTAYEEDEEADYTARTTWGIFWLEKPPPEGPPPKVQPLRKIKRPPPPPIPAGQWCAILLERLKVKVEFPDLRKLAAEHYRTYQPDRVLIEKKVSGHSLLQELRRNKVPVKALKADRSKLARAHAAAVVLEQGAVWYMDLPWALEVIDDCAKATFKRGDPGNDVGDTCVHAWTYLRNTFHLQLADEDDEDDEKPARETRIGYGM